MKLAQKNAIVTGGASGMGRLIATQLADEGANVAVLAPEEELLEEAATSLQREGNQTCALLCDVCNEQQIQQTIQEVKNRFGSIDILVNNAGIAGPTAPLQDVQLADWEKTLAINLTGAYLCSQQVLPGMIEQKSGRIVNISSMAGRIAFPLRGPYAASKWGLVGLTLAVAKEVGADGIQVNAICPGPVAGQRIDDVIASKAAEEGREVADVNAEFVDTTLPKRFVKQEDVANMVVYLCSDAGAAITGQALEISCGYAI